MVDAAGRPPKARIFGVLTSLIILTAPIPARGQTADSTYGKVLALDLERLPPPIATYFSHGYGARAAALQHGAREVRELLIDSLDVDPAAIELIVLDDRDWSRVTDLPYGLHTWLELPSAFLAPAQVDRGIYHPEELPDDEAMLRVDVIGLHYLAHVFAGEALYGSGSSDASVKWLDELFTLILQDELLSAVDPALFQAGRRFEEEAKRLTAPRVRTLEEFDREYRGYFITREGGANYAWFLARLAAWSRAVRKAHGLEIFNEVRSALSSRDTEMDAMEGLQMLEALGVDVAGWRER